MQALKHKWREIVLSVFIGVGLWIGAECAQATTVRDLDLLFDVQSSSNLRINHKTSTGLKIDGTITNSQDEVLVDISGSSVTVGFKTDITSTSFVAQASGSLVDSGTGGQWTVTLPAAQWVTNISSKLRLWGDVRISGLGNTLPSMEMWLYPSANTGDESTYLQPTDATWLTNGVTPGDVSILNFGAGFTTTFVTGRLDVTALAGSDTTNATGINADFASPTNYSPAATDVSSHLKALDSALGGLSSVTNASQINADFASPTNYTPAGPNVDDHFIALDGSIITAAERTKLSGIESGATLNSTDAFLLARGNHTGTQPRSTISDFDAGVTANPTVGSNTTHRTSNGADHGFINQDVTTTGTPTWPTVNTTNILGGGDEMVFDAQGVSDKSITFQSDAAAFARLLEFRRDALTAVFNLNITDTALSMVGSISHYQFNTNGTSYFATGDDGFISWTVNTGLNGRFRFKDEATDRIVMENANLDGDGNIVSNIVLGADVNLNAANITNTAALATNSPSANDVLKFTSGTNYRWEAESGGGGSLDDLSDVDINAPSEGNKFTFDGSKWTNTVPLVCTMYLATQMVNITVATPTKILYDTALIDTGGFANPASNRIDLVRQGTYAISHHAFADGYTTANRGWLSDMRWIRGDGSATNIFHGAGNSDDTLKRAGANIGPLYITTTGTVDFIEAFGTSQDSANTVDIQGKSGDFIGNWLSIEYLGN